MVFVSCAAAERVVEGRLAVLVSACRAVCYVARHRKALWYAMTETRIESIVAHRERRVDHRAQSGP